MSRNFTKETKRLAWDRCNGRCEFIRNGERCNAALTAGNRIYDHADPWELCFDSSLGNCQVICVCCHREKTSDDQAAIAKAKRQSDFHLGITGPGLGRHPMAAGRLSRLKKTFRHGVVPRATQVELYRQTMRNLYGEGWEP